MPVPNSDYVPDPFPGVSAGLNSAPGSAGNRTPNLDGIIPGGLTGLPGVGVTVNLADEAGSGESASTTQPGQVSETVISPGPSTDYLSTGAGSGRARVDSSGRYDWQQKAGGQ